MSNNKWKKSLNALLATSLVASIAVPAMPANAEVVGPATDLIISEYVEGSSLNKAIELYNGTGETIDLSQYTLELYSNGEAISKAVSLTGALENGATYIVYHGGAADAIKNVGQLEDNTVINFNGDDAIVLKKGTTVIDSIGQVGKRVNNLADVSLVRNSNRTVGDIVIDDPFNPAEHWTNLGKDIFDNLGQHKMDDVNIDPEPPVDKAEAVTTSILSGTVEAGTSITLSTITEGAKIHYTMDGSEPTTASPVYTTPIIIEQSTTIKAIAVAEGLESSEVNTFTYTVIGEENTGSIADAREKAIGETVTLKGVVAAKLKNTISVQDETGGIAVRPTTLDVQLGEEVTLTGKLADFNGLLQLDSASIVEKGSNVGVPQPKTITGDGVSETNESQLVTVEGITLTLDSEGTGLKNYKATDASGKTFLIRDEKADLDLAVNTNYESITGIVQQFKNDYQIIPRGAADIVLDSTTLQPAIASPAPGTYVGAQTVSLSATTAGAEIFYTKDGSLPTVESTKYEGPITINENTIIKAIVKAQDGTLSKVSTFDYKITDSLQIHDIQGEAHKSPLLGNAVKDIQGIVTYNYKIGNNNYFHMQTPDDLNDDNPNTSEAIIVFTGNQVLANKGNLVKVSGKVDEFQIDGYTDSKRDTDLSVTQINARTDQGGAITVVTKDVELPAAVTIDASNLPKNVIDNDGFAKFDPEEDAIDFWESLEGMLVDVGSVKAVSPQEHGDLITVLEDRQTDTIHGGVKLTEESANPDRIQFKLFDNSAARNFEVATGDKFTGPIQGVVNYGFQNYKIYADYEYMKAKHQKGNTKPETTTISKDEKKLTIASYNLENFSNNTKETTDDKARKLARAFVQDMKSPDIIGVTEVQDNNGSSTGDSKADQSYQRLINAIKTAGGPEYKYLNIDPENNTDGGAPNANIRVGFLYNPERVSLPKGIESGNATTAVGYENGSLTLNPGRIDPTNAAFNSSRKPLAAQFTFQDEDVIIIANHWNSKSGDTPLFGSTQPPVYESEKQRKEIAQIVYNFVEDIKKKNPNANIVSVGDFNDFQFTDALKIHEGQYMTNMINKVAEKDRYTYLFQGNSQVLDHILVSNNLVDNAEVDILHINADFTDMAGRASDHDPVLVQIDLKNDSSVEPIQAEKVYNFKNFKTNKLKITKPSVAVHLDAQSVIANGVLFNGSYMELHGEGFKTTDVTLNPNKAGAILDLKANTVKSITIDGPNVKEIRGAENLDFKSIKYINGATPEQIKFTNSKGDPIVDPSLPSENNEPIIKKPLENKSVAIGEVIQIDLTNHFSDPDGDELSFTSTKGTVNGEILNLQLEEGTHIVAVTASDGSKSITSRFSVTVGAEDYYMSAMNKEGQALKTALHDIISKQKVLSYDEVWDALKYTDEDPKNNNNVVLFYSGKSRSKSSDGGNAGDWNREHTWAKSHGDFGTSKGPGTDIHHLRPTDVQVNGSRGNLDFDKGGSPVAGCDGCLKDSDSFEPPNRVKGDVARILFYMATRYEAGDKVDLELNDKVNNGKAPYHGKLSVLLQWHQQDPVDEIEKQRNERIYEIQGNRNPFIDHPEWVKLIWK
ncbi:endonuclease [Solibacillus sp. R5-41]|uniref:endonuclease n=1 Tax=Solibacillus sp. R5-41 TaxID=2048654 RepID=UPI001562A2DF|nr:endonuclease [Solibacillus sp. R5-41]